MLPGNEMKARGLRGVADRLFPGSGRGLLLAGDWGEGKPGNLANPRDPPTNPHRKLLLSGEMKSSNQMG